MQEQSPEGQTQTPSPDHLHPGPGCTVLPHQPPAGVWSHTTSHTTVRVCVCVMTPSLLVLFLCQTFSGMSSDGRPLVFRLPEPSYPSQYHNRLDLSDVNTPPYCSLQTHTQEVYGFKTTTTVSSAVWHGGNSVLDLLSVLSLASPLEDHPHG